MANADEWRSTLGRLQTDLQAELDGLGTDRDSERRRAEIGSELRQLKEADYQLRARAASFRSPALGILSGASKFSMDAILGLPALALQAPQLLSSLGNFFMSPIETTSNAYDRARTALTNSREEANAAIAAGEPGRAFQTYTQQGLTVLSLGMASAGPVASRWITRVETERALGSTAGHGFAERVLEGGTGTAFAGHGYLRQFDGMTEVPPGAAITLPRDGIRITERTGQYI